MDEGVRVRRREFIVLLGGAGATWPLALRAQRQPKIRRIGILDDTPRWNVFRSGLRELGYREGENIAFDYTYDEGVPERLAEAAVQLVRRGVDVIATYGTAATFAAMQATTMIPIVMISVGDPVRAGLVPSLGHPGGNVTGNTILGPDMSAKRFQLIQELIPMVARVAFLWNPNNASHAAYRQELQAAAPALNVKLQFIEVGSATEFHHAFAAIMRERPDAFSMTGDPLHQLHIGRIIDFMANNRLPAVYQLSENVRAGGLMSYGPNQSDLYRRAATYVDKILKGAKPADLPVEQPTTFELVINLKTAKALGLTVSPSLLARADEVME